MTAPPPSEHTYDRVAETAIWAAQHGFSVSPPPLEEGTKRPQSSWQRYIETAASPEVVEGWYKARKTGFGLITGPASHNLDLLEFDDMGTWEAFQGRTEEQAVGHLVDRVKCGYLERSPRGVHCCFDHPASEATPNLHSVVWIAGTSRYSLKRVAKAATSSRPRAMAASTQPANRTNSSVEV
jgi:hypothetical protein